jgi:alpha-glucosidase
MDDGRSFAYKQGSYLRMEFTCSETPGGITVHIGPHQGSYIPWWKDVQVEIYGRAAPSREASIVGSKEKAETSFDSLNHVARFILPDNGRGTELQVQWIR